MSSPTGTRLDPILIDVAARSAERRRARPLADLQRDASPRPEVCWRGLPRDGGP